MMRQQSSLTKRQKIWGVFLAFLIHALVFILIFVKWPSSDHVVTTPHLADKVDIVKATTVDESAIKQYQEDLKKKAQEKEEKERKEKERLEKIKRDAEKEEQRIKELKEQQELEKQKAKELEAQRKKIALEKKKEEEQRKKAREEKKRKEALAKKKKEQEKKQREEAERKRKEKIAREQAERERQQREQAFVEQLAEEEQRVDRLAKERTTTIIGKYSALIIQKVLRNITIAPDFTRDLTAKVNVKLSPSGEVISVRTVKSSGNIRYDRAVNTAIYQSSPLPIPSREEMAGLDISFNDLILNFDLKDL